MPTILTLYQTVLRKLTPAEVDTNFTNLRDTADTAKTTADTAKTTADTAKTTADTAKATADAAKTVTDKVSTVPGANKIPQLDAASCINYGIGTAATPWFRMSWGGATDTAWKKVATVVLPAGTYKGAAFELEVVEGWYSLQGGAKYSKNRFAVTITRSAAVDLDCDSAVIFGTVANAFCRVVKTGSDAGQSIFELQVREETTYRRMEVVARMISSSGATITYATAETAGATVGTIYTSDASLAPAAATTTVETGTWTPTVRGSGTAGTYEFTATECNYVKANGVCRITAVIKFAAVVTGGGTLYLQIGGVPFPRNSSGNSNIGTVALSSNAYGAGNIPYLAFSSTTTTLMYIYLMSSGAGAGILGISTAVPNSTIIINMEYLTA